jgi:hypothetical protein
VVAPDSVTVRVEVVRQPSGGQAGAPPAGSGCAARGTGETMTDPEQAPDVEQRLAEQVDTERHRAPSEGIPQDLPDDADAEEGHPT